ARSLAPDVRVLRDDCAIHWGGAVPVPARQRRHLAPGAAFLLRRERHGNAHRYGDAFRAVLPPRTTTADRARTRRRRTCHTGGGDDSLRLARWFHRAARRRHIRAARLHDGFSAGQTDGTRRDPRRVPSVWPALKPSD